jgi:4-hydroxy-4-methyl-2-oxoglutarate aldolase
MNPVIRRKIERPEISVINLLSRLGVATIHEAQLRSGLMRPYMRPIFPEALVAGPAVTVSCQPGDNLMIHASIDVVERGDVLVVTTTAESTDGMFGELLAESCRAHGVRGLVIDAGVRDVSELTAMQFPVWSKAISAQGTVKATAGSVNIPVVCAGALVNPGDVIVGDLDGVVVIRREEACQVAHLAQQRRAKEERARERLRGGEKGLDMYGLREKLRELGVEYSPEEALWGKS